MHQRHIALVHCASCTARRLLNVQSLECRHETAGNLSIELAGFTFRAKALPGETNRSSAVLKGGLPGTLFDPR